MNKRLLFGAIAIPLLVGIVVISHTWTSTEGKALELRIGVLSFLTGIFADMGQDLVNGAQLAQEEGGSFQWFVTNKVNIKLYVEDGKAEAKSTVDGFSRLSLKSLSAAVVAGDTPVPAAAPLIKRSKIPTLATIVSTSGFLEKNAAWIFRNYVSVSDAARSMAEYCVSHLDIKKVGVLYMRSEYGEEGARAFVDSLKELGDEAIFKESFSSEDKDCRTIAAKIAALKVPAVYVLGYGNSYNTAVNQLRECGFDGYILTDEPISSPGSKSAIKNFSKIIFTSQATPTTERYDDFTKKYQKRYGTQPSLYAAYGFDSVSIIIQAVANVAQDVKPESIRSALLSGNSFDTLRGSIMFKEDGDCLLPIVINEMEGGGSYHQVR